MGHIRYLCVNTPLWQQYSSILVELELPSESMIPMEEKDLILLCQRQNRSAQNALWQQYAPLMMSICLRYLKHMETAEDILVQSFYRIFRKIDTFKSEGSFEGWMKRIVVNECLMEIRKRKSNFLTLAIDDINEDPYEEAIDTLEYEELLQLLDSLPDGYRTVFNLYVIEGYKHKEIADSLGISINTSKSQLLLARRRLQEYYKKKYNHILTTTKMA